MLKVIKKYCVSILATVALMLGCITPVLAKNESMFKIVYPDKTELEYETIEEVVSELEKSELEGVYTLILLQDVSLEKEITLPKKDLIIDGDELTLTTKDKIITSNETTFKNIVLDMDKELLVGKKIKFDKTVTFKKDKSNDDLETQDPNLDNIDKDESDDLGLDDNENDELTDPDETKDPQDDSKTPAEDQTVDETGDSQEGPKISEDDPKVPKGNQTVDETSDPQEEPKAPEDQPEVPEDDPKVPEKDPAPTKETNSWNVVPSIGNIEYGQTLNLVCGKPAFGNIEDVVYTYSDKKDGRYTSNAPTNVGTWYLKASLAETETYTGLEEIIEFDITPKKVVNITIPTIGPDTKLMEMVIKDGDKQLIVGTDYTIKMQVKNDTTIVTITFMNNYTGEIVRTYKVEKPEIKNPEKPKEETKKVVKKKGVQTSTSTNQTMWLTVLGLSVFVIAVLFFFKKKS